MIPIVYCLDKNFVKITKISIDSLLKYNPNARVELIVPEHIPELSSFKQHIIDEEKLKSQYIRDYDRITMFTYARLFIPEILFNDEMCLYIDGDILVNTNLEELYKTYVPFIGAVKDANPGWLLDGIEKPVYYNAGVLLMNLENLRKDGFTKKCIDYIANCEETYLGKEGTWLHDQTTINALYSEKITNLDSKWNRQLSWDPPEKYEKINFSDACVHFLTAYNKGHMYRYAAEHSDDFPSIGENIDVILVLTNPDNVGYYKQTIDSILNQRYNKFTLHIFAGVRNKQIDRFFDKFESDRVKLYDVCHLFTDNNSSKIYDYVKEKITTEKVVIVDENMVLVDYCFDNMITFGLSSDLQIVFGLTSMTGSDKDNEVFRYPHPKDVRAETPFYAYVREQVVMCPSKLFKDFDFSSCGIYPMIEFYSFILFYNNYGVTIDTVSYYRDIYYNRSRFYNAPMHVSAMIKRFFSRMGYEISEKISDFLNPYINAQILLTVDESHTIKRLRRKMELSKDVYNNDILYRYFKI